MIASIPRMIEQAVRMSLLEDLSLIEEVGTIRKPCLLLPCVLTISGMAGGFSLY
jgi:hypothetical protein